MLFRSVPGCGSRVRLKRNARIGDETVEARRRRARKIFDRLRARNRDVRIELDFRTPIQLLVSVILSAQCTDRRVNLVTPALFRRFRTVADYANASAAELEHLIKSCGLYRTKSRNIIAAAKELVTQHQGKVPNTRAELETLPGVGRKTAGVVCIHLGGDAAFPVDTHIRRIAKRMGLSRSDDPDQVELDLRKLLPVNRWAIGHLLLIRHGRRICFARAPACVQCAVSDLCPKRGVSRFKGLSAAASQPPSGAAFFSGSARA